MTLRSVGRLMYALQMVFLLLPGSGGTPNDAMSDTIDRISNNYAKERAVATRGDLKPEWCSTKDLFWFWDTDDTLTVVDPHNISRMHRLQMSKIKDIVAEASHVGLEQVSIQHDAFTKPNKNDTLLLKYAGFFFAIDILSATIRQLDAATYDWFAMDVPKLIHPNFPYTFRKETVEVPSADDKWFATLIGDNLAIRSRSEDTKKVPLTSDGANRFSYDSASQYVEKFDVAWSPVANKLAAAKLDTRRIYYLPLLHVIDPRPTVQYAQMPLHEDPTEETEFSIFDVLTRKQVKIALGNTKEHYSSIQGWSPDGKVVYIEKVSRDWKNLEIIQADAVSGRTRTVLRDHEDTFIDSWMILGPEPFYPLKRGLLFLSEHNGYREIYYYDRDGKLLRQLTDGDLPIQRIVAADERTGWVYYQAPLSRKRPYDSNFFRVSLSGGEPQLLAAAPGDHKISISPSREYFVDTFSSFGTPYTTELRSADGELVSELARGDLTALRGMGWTPPEEFAIRTVDGRWDSHGAIFYPKNFDPSRKYPVIEFIYGDMFVRLTPNFFYWGGPYGTFEHVLAEEGYIVITVDSPGTPGLGKSYNDVTYGIFPQGIVANHVHAIRELSKNRPYLDLTRVGIFGISSGGMMVERALTDAPGFYKVAVAVNPAGDVNAFPGTWYEFDLGLLSANPQGYRNAGILPHADRIAAKLLIFGSSLDTDAGFPASVQMVDAMIRARKDVDFMILPRNNHNLDSVDEETYWWFNAYCLRYLQRHL